jgi:hypothetical protein
MNRRAFVSRVTFGGVAAACTGFGQPVQAAPGSGHLRMRFIGMMAFVERADHSFLVATPGQHHMHHINHVPFLMARAGTPIAKALRMTPVAGVVPAAFDTELEGARPSDYVYLNLANSSIEVVSGATDAVGNHASEMAQLQAIAPGKRVRGNIERWASTTVSLRGGRLDNSSAHPDAHKVWAFGSYRQKLTDAVNFTNVDRAATTIRITSGTDVRSYQVKAGEACDLTMISSATPEARGGSINKLIHSQVVFDYLVDAPAVLAECDEATGRDVPPTEVPFANATSASNGIIASAAMAPPVSEFCFIACILFGSSATK